MAVAERIISAGDIHPLLRSGVFWERQGVKVPPPIPLSDNEVIALNAYQIFVPEEHATPHGLRRFSLAPGEVANPYLFQIQRGVAVSNDFTHIGWRNITFKRPDMPEGITLNEYVIAAKTHPEFASLVGGRWVRVSGSSSPEGKVLNVMMDPHDRSLICYFGDEIKRILEFSSSAPVVPI